MVVRTEPKVASSDVMQVIKSISARVLNMTVLVTVRIYKPYKDQKGDITIGRKDMYVMPRDELDSLIESTNGDLGAIEKALGFHEGQLSGGDYKIAFLDDVNTKVSLPTGNEAGVNENWVPGGFTSGGIPEATYTGSEFEKDHFTQTLDDFFGG